MKKKEQRKGSENKGKEETIHRRTTAQGRRWETHGKGSEEKEGKDNKVGNEGKRAKRTQRNTGNTGNT